MAIFQVLLLIIRLNNTNSKVLQPFISWIHKVFEVYLLHLMAIIQVFLLIIRLNDTNSNCFSHLYLESARFWWSKNPMWHERPVTKRSRIHCKYFDCAQYSFWQCYISNCNLAVHYAMMYSKFSYFLQTDFQFESPNLLFNQN